MSSDVTRISNVMVVPPDVRILDVDDSEYFTITIEKMTGAPTCPTCSTIARLKDRRVLTPVDPPCRGCATKVIWRKRR